LIINFYEKREQRPQFNVLGRGKIILCRGACEEISAFFWEFINFYSGLIFIAKFSIRCKKRKSGKQRGCGTASRSGFHRAEKQKSKRSQRFSESRLPQIFE
jgi:hypothetical protein